MCAVYIQFIRIQWSAMIAGAIKKCIYSVLVLCIWYSAMNIRAFLGRLLMEGKTLVLRVMRDERERFDHSLPIGDARLLGTVFLVPMLEEL